jgi:hypothetical protein
LCFKEATFWRATGGSRKYFISQHYFFRQQIQYINNDMLDQRLHSAILSTCLFSSVFALAPYAQLRQQRPNHIRPTGFAPLQAVATIETPPSPLTAWGNPISDIRKLQQLVKKQPLPDFATELSSADVGIASDDTKAQLVYFRDHAMEIKQKMQDHGAVILRGFDLMKTQEGFQNFYNALGMKVCQDPLQSVSARPTADGKKDSPVYEAVNKESRKNFFIGKCDRQELPSGTLGTTLLDFFG